jgi:hypothetical protein
MSRRGITFARTLAALCLLSVTLVPATASAQLDGHQAEVARLEEEYQALGFQLGAPVPPDCFTDPCIADRVRKARVEAQRDQILDQLNSVRAELNVLSTGYVIVALLQAERPDQEVNEHALGGCALALNRGVGARDENGRRLEVGMDDPDTFVPAILSCYLAVVPPPEPPPPPDPTEAACGVILAGGGIFGDSAFYAPFMAQCVAALQAGGRFVVTPAHATPPS